MLQAVKSPEEAAMSAGTEKEVPIQPVSLDIWDKKYRLKSKQGDHVDKDMDDSYQRVARALADVEEEGKRAEWHEKFLWALRRGAIPAGRITSNAGALEHKPATSTINCTVSGIVEDSMDGILGKVHEAGLTLKAGIDLYGDRFGIDIRDGKIIAIENRLKATTNIMSLPVNLLVPLIMGGKTLSELHTFYPDAFAHEPWQALTEVLFPKAS